MKRRFYKSIAMMLTLVLVLGSFSVSALAANNKTALDSISHTSAVSAEIDTQSSTITLTVPYSYIGDVVLSSGLSIVYDTSDYRSASAEFPDGATAIVGGDAVRMRITYLSKSDATPSTNEYTVRVVRAAQIGPAFSGTISKSASLPDAVVFTVADFSEKYTQNEGGVLDSIQITGSDPTFGSLKLGTVTALDKIIKVSDLQNGNLTFVPTDTGVVSYTVSAYVLGKEDAVGTAILKITVKEIEEEEEEDVDTEDEDSDHFSDVGENVKWAVEAIDYLYEKGILTGTGTGYYNPAASISRADFMLMLTRAFDLEADFNSSDNFSDVDDDDYYYSAVAAAKKLGITKGSNGKFNPKSALSRQDAMVLLVRALEVAGIELPDGTDSILHPFKDKNKVSEYATDAFEILVQAGIVQGSDNSLNPNSSVSRAEIAVILHRILTM